MFQACVSISVCIFSVFMTTCICIHRVCVYKWAYCWVKFFFLPTYLPYFSVARYSNTVEPHYNEVLGTMKITLLYQVSHCIRVK